MNSKFYEFNGVSLPKHLVRKLAKNCCISLGKVLYLLSTLMPKAHFRKGNNTSNQVALGNPMQIIPQIPLNSHIDPDILPMETLLKMNDLPIDVSRVEEKIETLSTEGQSIMWGNPGSQQAYDKLQELSRELKLSLDSIKSENAKMQYEADVNHFTRVVSKGKIKVQTGDTLAKILNSAKLNNLITLFPGNVTIPKLKALLSASLKWESKVPLFYGIIPHGDLPLYVKFLMKNLATTNLHKLVFPGGY